MHLNGDITISLCQVFQIRYPELDLGSALLEDDHKKFHGRLVAESLLSALSYWSSYGHALLMKWQMCGDSIIPELSDQHSFGDALCGLCIWEVI